MQINPDRFCNIILCEDVRDEIGGKHSLMGVFSGDILIPIFPATIQLATYFQYEMGKSAQSEGKVAQDEIDFAITMFVDDRKIATGRMNAPVKGGEKFANFVMPKSLLTFDKPSRYRLVITLSDGRELEILNKQILQGTVGG